MAYIFSLFLGVFGADQFYLGFIGKGLAKLFTFGGLGIWWVMDVIRIGSSPPPSAHYLAAADLPHQAYVLTCSMYAVVIGFLVAYYLTVTGRARRRQEAMAHQLDEESCPINPNWRRDPALASIRTSQKHIEQMDYIEKLKSQQVEGANRWVFGHQEGIHEKINLLDKDCARRFADSYRTCHAGQSGETGFPKVRKEDYGHAVGPMGPVDFIPAAVIGPPPVQMPPVPTRLSGLLPEGPRQYSVEFLSGNDPNPKAVY